MLGIAISTSAVSEKHRQAGRALQPHVNKVLIVRYIYNKIKQKCHSLNILLLCAISSNRLNPLPPSKEPTHPPLLLPPLLPYASILCFIFCPRLWFSIPLGQFSVVSSPEVPYCNHDHDETWYTDGEPEDELCRVVISA